MAGYTINQLPTATELSAGDKIVVFVTDEGSAYKASLTTLLAFFSDAFASPEFEVQTFIPTSGNTITITASTSNIWAILRPATALASLTVVLPALADAVDGQEIIISCEAAVASLSLSGNGADVVGDITAVPPNGASYRFRFNETASTWYLVGSSTSASIDVGGDDFTLSGGTVAVDSASTVAITAGTSMTVDASTNLVIRGDAISIGVEAAGRGVSAIGYNPQTLATLQALSTSLGNRPGLRAVCSNHSGAVTFGANVTGGGSTMVPALFNGTNWIMG